MNKLKLLLLPLFAAIVMFSCDNDDVKELPEEPIEPSSALLTLNLDMENFKYQAENTTVGEVTIDIDCRMETMTELIFLFHNAVNEEFVSMKTETDIQSLKTEDGGYALKDYSLPFGHYYVTVIACMVEKPLAQKDLMPLITKYSKSICCIPNTMVFYKTEAVSMKKENETEATKKFSKDIVLERVTKAFFSYQLIDWDKVPANAKIEATAKVRSLPSSFFIKDGRTLSDEEHTQYNLSKFGSEKTVKDPEKKINFVTYFLLSNEHLKEVPNELGVFTFSFTQNGVTIKDDQLVLHKHGQANWESYAYITEIYGEEIVEEIEEL